MTHSCGCGRNPYVMVNPLKDYPKSRPPMPKSFYVTCQEEMHRYHSEKPNKPWGDSDFALIPRVEDRPMVTWSPVVVDRYSNHVKETDGFHVKANALPPKYSWNLNGVIHPFDISLGEELVLSACNHAVDAFNLKREENKDSIGQLKFLKVEDCMVQLFTAWSHVFLLTFTATLVPRGDVLTCQAKVVLEPMLVLAFRFNPPPPSPDGGKSETKWLWKEEYVGAHCLAWSMCKCVETTDLLREEEEAKILEI